MSWVMEKTGDVIEGAVDTVSDIGSGIDDFVREEIPGGWLGAAALATGGAALAGALPGIGAAGALGAEAAGMTAAEAAAALAAQEAGIAGLGALGAESLAVPAALGATEAAIAPSLYSLSAAAPGAAGMGGGTGLLMEGVAPSLASMGGAQGLVTEGLAPALSGMGGGTGLLAPAIGGGIVGAGGLVAPSYAASILGQSTPTILSQIGDVAKKIATNPNILSSILGGGQSATGQRTGSGTGSGTGTELNITPDNRNVKSPAEYVFENQLNPAAFMLGGSQLGINPILASSLRPLGR